MGVRGASTFPLRNRLPCLDSLVERPCSYSLLGFLIFLSLDGINILVATLFTFGERATADDSAGDVIDLCWSFLSESILAFVFSFIRCFFVCLYVYILYIY